MWPRKRFDIGWLDLLDGLLGCLACWDRQRAESRLERAWSLHPDALACLSVRSGWDLLLAAADFPRGSEVLLSAVTIPDMARITEHHGLVPVPLDLDPDTMLPHPEQIAAAATPRTKAVLVAHFFGASAPLDEHIAVARRHGLLFIEDCAQAFRGRNFTGHAQADASMFSFGSIKTSTALGGGLLCVRDAALLARMRQLQETYPVQRGTSYLRRIVKYAGLKAMSYRATFRALIGLLRLAGKDFDRVLNNCVRGFPGHELLPQLRQQPCAPLLRLMNRRLRTFNEARMSRASRRGRDLVRALSGEFLCPGAARAPHAFWVFPVLVESPAAARLLFLDHGFDATCGQSLVAVPAPPGRPEMHPRAAQEILEHLLFPPFYEGLPDSELERMARLLREHRSSVDVHSAAAYVGSRRDPATLMHAGVDRTSDRPARV